MKRVLFAIAIIAVSANFPAPLFPVYQTAFHLNTFAITALFAIYAACLLPVLLCAGPIAEKIGPKWVATFGVILVFISAGIFLIATNPGMLYLARAVEGIALGAFMGTGPALLLHHSPSNRTAHTLTLSSMATLIGFGLGPAITGMVIEYIHWKQERLPFSILLIVVGMTIILLLTVTGPNDHVTTRSRFRIHLGIPTESRRLFWTFIGPAAFAMLALNGVVISLIPTYVRTILHSHNLAWSGWLLLVFLGGGAIAQRSVWPANQIRRAQVGIALLLIGTWFMVIAGPLSSMAILWIGMILLATGNGWTFQASMQLVGGMSRQPADHARILSTFYVAAYTGMAFPTIGVGLLSVVCGLIPALVLFGIVISNLSVGVMIAPRWFRREG